MTLVYREMRTQVIMSMHNQYQATTQLYMIVNNYHYCKPKLSYGGLTKKENTDELISFSDINFGRMKLGLGQKHSNFYGLHFLAIKVVHLFIISREKWRYVL